MIVLVKEELLKGMGHWCNRHASWQHPPVELFCITTEHTARTLPVSDGRQRYCLSLSEYPSLDNTRSAVLHVADALRLSQVAQPGMLQPSPLCTAPGPTGARSRHFQFKLNGNPSCSLSLLW